MSASEDYVYMASMQLYIRRIRIKKYIHQKVESVLKLVGKMAKYVPMKHALTLYPPKNQSS